MPGTGDSPEGVHPNVQVENNGMDVLIWIKGKVHGMSVSEARALARALTTEADALDALNPSIPLLAPAEVPDASPT